jgi:hypothetical protein
MFDGREKLDGIKVFFAQILRYISGKLPDTLQDEFRDLSLLGIRRCTSTWEWFYDLKE